MSAEYIQRKQTARAKSSAQRNVDKVCAPHYEDSDETAQKNPCLRKPDVAHGGTEAVRNAIDLLVHKIQMTDPIKKATEDPSWVPSKSKLDIAALVLFAERQKNSTWSIDSFATLDEACKTSFAFDWIRMAWTQDFGTDGTPANRHIHGDMLLLPELNPYACMLEIYLNFTRSDVAAAFIKTFVAQEGAFGAAFLYALHTTIPFGIHFSQTSPCHQLIKRPSDWCIPAGASIVKAFYDYTLAGDCKTAGKCTDMFCGDLAHAFAYSCAFVPTEVYFETDHHSDATYLLDGPKCGCRLSLKNHQ